MGKPIGQFQRHAQSRGRFVAGEAVSESVVKRAWRRDEAEPIGARQTGVCFNTLVVLR